MLNSEIVDNWLQNVTRDEHGRLILRSEEMDEETYELSPWIEQNCRNLWNMENRLGEELERHGDMVGADGGNSLNAMKDMASGWTRQQCLDYHMGNNRKSGRGSTCSIKWAFQRCTSKINVIKELFEEQPTTYELAIQDLKNIQRYLNTNNKDELIMEYINQEWEFWSRMTDDELKEI